MTTKLSKTGEAPHLSELVDVDALKRQIDEGWIKAQTDGHLTIYNYTPSAMSQRIWTPETLTCRGLIVGPDGQVVARPFPKFFNLGEHEPGSIPAVGFKAYTKADGSLGIGYTHPRNGTTRISTRGSLTSDIAEEATRMLHAQHGNWQPPEGITPLFEIIYPENRIVLDYGPMRALVLLAAIDIRTGADVPMDSIGWDGPTVEPLNTDRSVNDLQQWMETDPVTNHEGYVLVYPREGQPSLRVKLKYAEYVAMHRAITGVSNETIWKLQATETVLAETSNVKQAAAYLRLNPEFVQQVHDGTVSLKACREGLPDELWEWFDTQVEQNLEKVTWMTDLHRQIVADTVRRNGTNRKAAAAYFAEVARHNRNVLTGILFHMLDQDGSAPIWRSIRPEDIERPADSQWGKAS